MIIINVANNLNKEHSDVFNNFKFSIMTDS